jgi:hypothetical protein
MDAELLEARFWSKVEKTPTCWIYKGTVHKKDFGLRYAMVRRGKSRHMAAQIAWVYVNGPIPAGLIPDHLCRNGLCVRPDHLELVTVGENVRRGVSVVAENARKTHCKRGHPFAGDNLYRFRTPWGWGRMCKTCNAMHKRKRA